jgi:hypothetical protein
MIEIFKKCFLGLWRTVGQRKTYIDNQNIGSVKYRFQRSIFEILLTILIIDYRTALQSGIIVA